MLKAKSRPAPEGKFVAPWHVEPSSQKALLLRVGIDRGTGGALGPIFENGTFEYIPIPEQVPTRCLLTYATLEGRHVRSLAALLPARLAGRHPHIDPDFKTATYGDAAPHKRRQLLRLAHGDILVFYAGLAPRALEDRPRLFAVGSLTVRHVHHLRPGDPTRHDLQRKFGQTAHLLRVRSEELALVEGEPRRSGLFARAIPLGDGRNCLCRDLIPLGYRGSLLRSVGHWITGESSIPFLKAWLRQGPASLVSENTRLIRIAGSALQLSHRSGDLAVKDRHVREGDWIIAPCARGTARVLALARINRTASAAEGFSSSSLFWLFSGRGPALPDPSSSLLRRQPILLDTAAIRRLVSWFDKHYRIGLFQSPPQSLDDAPCGT